MFRRFMLISLLVAGLFSLTGCTGLPSAPAIGIPQRVISTHPGATELLLELGLDRHILAATPPYGKPLPHLAAATAALPVLSTPLPSEEELLALHPDFVIGWEHQFVPGQLGEQTRWQNRGAATLIMPSSRLSPPQTLENTLYPLITEIGRRFNVNEAAAQLLAKCQQRLASIQNRIPPAADRKRVIILQDHFNGTYSLYDARFLISHLAEQAGAENLCRTPSLQVGPEEVAAYQPDYIIFVSYNPADLQRDLTADEAVRHLQSRPLLQLMPAIQAGRIIPLPFFTVNNGGIRAIAAVEQLAAALYSVQP